MSQSLVKNSVFNVASRLLSVLFPLITTTYVARILCADGVGKVAYAQNIVAYFIYLAALGLPNYGVREIAKVRNDLSQTSKLFSELIIINFCSTCFFSIAYYIFIFSSSYFQNNILLHCVVGLSLIFNIFNVTWFYQGFEDFVYITVRSFIVKIVCLGWIFLCVRTKEDVVLYALAAVLANGLTDMINVFHLRKFKIRIILKNSNLKKHFKPLIILFASSIAIELYTMLDTTMIGWFCNETAVGLYTNSIKIIRILIGVISGIAGVLLPRLSLYYSRNEIEKCSETVSKVMMVMIFLYLPCQIGLIMEGDIIMPLLFGETFTQGGITLQIASILICTLGFSSLFATQVLLTFGQEKKIFLCTLFAAIINLILNVILIPSFAQNGAAVASVVAEGFVTTAAYIYSKKYVHIQIKKRFILVSFFSSLFLIGLFAMAKHLFDSYLFIFLFSLIVGGIIYLSFNIIFKNPILDIFKRKMKFFS